MSYIYCSSCGKQIPDNVSFCPNCGAPVAQQQDSRYDAPGGYGNGQQGGYGPAGQQGGYGNGQPGGYGPAGQQGYRPQGIQEPSKGLAIASMVIGICSVVFSWLPYLAITLGVLALIFGIVSLARKMGGKGMAIAGIVTGAVGCIYWLSIIDSISRVFRW